MCPDEGLYITICLSLLESFGSSVYLLLPLLRELSGLFGRARHIPRENPMEQIISK